MAQNEQFCDKVTNKNGKAEKKAKLALNNSGTTNSAVLDKEGGKLYCTQVRATSPSNTVIGFVLL